MTSPEMIAAIRKANKIGLDGQKISGVIFSESACDDNGPMFVIDLSDKTSAADEY